VGQRALKSHHKKKQGEGRRRRRGRREMKGTYLYNLEVPMMTCEYKRRVQIVLTHPVRVAALF